MNGNHRQSLGITGRQSQSFYCFYAHFTFTWLTTLLCWKQGEFYHLNITEDLAKTVRTTKWRSRDLNPVSVANFIFLPITPLALIICLFNCLRTMNSSLFSVVTSLFSHNTTFRGYIFLICIFGTIFKKDFISLFLGDGKGGREGEREVSMGGCLSPAPDQDPPATQARALTGNRTCDPLVYRPALNPLSYTSPGRKNNCLR